MQTIGRFKPFFSNCYRNSATLFP